ncbi:hypothetical protein Tco_0920715 [Tanacetum coccineum]
MSINCSLQNEVIRVNLENESLKDEIFDLKKADESSFMSIPEITSDSESGCESQESLPPFPKLIGVAPIGTSDCLISLSDLTLNIVNLSFNLSVPRKTKPTSVKVSHAYVIKKKTKNKLLVVLEPCSDKKADSSTEQLLLAYMEEVKGLKRKMENLNEVRVKELRSDNGTKVQNHNSKIECDKWL